MSHRRLPQVSILILSKGPLLLLTSSGSAVGISTTIPDGSCDFPWIYASFEKPLSVEMRSVEAIDTISPSASSFSLASLAYCTSVSHICLLSHVHRLRARILCRGRQRLVAPCSVSSLGALSRRRLHHVCASCSHGDCVVRPNTLTQHEANCSLNGVLFYISS